MTPDDVPEGPVVIDTDVFSWVYSRRNRHEEFLSLVRGHLLCLSFATIGELRAGGLIDMWGDRRRTALEERMQQFVALPATDVVTSIWAAMYSRFRGRLKDGGINDMWTAACALAQPTPLPVVTGNLSDFKAIAGEFPLLLVHPDL